VAKLKPLLGVNMAVTRQGDRRKGNRRESGRRKGDIKEIKIEGVTDKEKEVTVCREAVSPKKGSSVWSWYEEFAAEWSESSITKERKKNPER